MLPIPEPSTAPDSLEKAVDAAEKPLNKKRIKLHEHLPGFYHHILTIVYTITLTLALYHKVDGVISKQRYACLPGETEGDAAAPGERDVPLFFCTYKKRRKTIKSKFQRNQYQ